MKNCNGNCMYSKCDCEDSPMSRLLRASQWALAILCILLMALTAGFWMGMQ